MKQAVVGVLLGFILISHRTAGQCCSYKIYASVGNLLNKAGLSNELVLKNRFKLGNETAFYWDVFPGLKNATYVSIPLGRREDCSYLQPAFLYGIHDLHPYFFRYQGIPQSQYPMEKAIGGSLSYVENGQLFKRRVLYGIHAQYYTPVHGETLIDRGYYYSGITRGQLWFTAFAGALIYFDVKWAIK